MKYPTQLEIATLAAPLTQAGHSPADAARLALELWRAAGTELREERIRADAAQRDQWQLVNARVGLDDLLKQALPNSKPEDRLKWWRECVRESLAAEGFVGDELETRMEERIREAREEGFRAIWRDDVIDQFRKWNDHRAAAARSARGKLARKKSE